MFAIYKKELKSYFTSVIACLFIFVTTLIAGIFFVYYNLQNGSPDMYSVSQCMFILVFTVPILTMKVIADEKRLKTDQLILTSPISVNKIVIGKFLSLVTIYLIPIVVMCIYPIILSRFGTISFKTAYTNIFGLFLYGIVFIAIGMFISSITESQVISAIISILVLLLGYMMGSLTSMISSDGNIITKILGCFDLYAPMENFLKGIITLSNVVYYLSLVVLFLFLTIQSIQKRRWNLSKKFIGMSIFSSGFVAVVVALVVFVNLIAGTITTNASWATKDMSSLSLYTISDDTVKMLKKLDSDIDLYVMASEAKADSTIKKTLERYETYSSHIKVEYKDTTKYPNFYEKYTDSTPTEGSIIVYSEKTKKSKVVDYNSIYVSDSYSYYTTGSSSATSYDCEGQLDSVIASVRTKNTYKIYQVEGHDEAVTDTTNFGSSSNLTDIISKYNCEVESVKLLALDSIPVSDCSAILLLGPKKDYTKAEADMVKKYLKKGGNAIIALEAMTSVSTDKPNFYSILKEYNIEVQKGVVAENNSSYYYSQYGPFYPLQEGSTGYASGLTSYVFTPYTMGLKQINKNSTTTTYTALASTTDKAVLKTDVTNATTYEKESKDKSGPFDTVVSVTKVVNEKSKKDSETTSVTSNMLVFGSVYALSDNVDGLVQNSNTEIVNNALSEYIDTDVTTVSVPAKSLTSDNLTVTESAAKSFGFILAIVLPVFVLIAGIVVWIRRRKH